MNFTFGGESARKRMLLRQERTRQEALRLQKAKVVVTSPMIQTELATPDNMTIDEAKLAIKHEEELKQKEREEHLKRMKEEEEAKKTEEAKKNREEEEAKKKEELLEKKRARRLAAKNARAEAKKKNKEEPVKIEEVVVTESIENLKNEVVAETQE